MLTELRDALANELARVVADRYGLQQPITIEVPPRRELGDLATPVAMQLARLLKRNPKAIAEELASALAVPALVRETRVVGAGYINFFLDRPAATSVLLEDAVLSAEGRPSKVIIEHTNINPNKAAHIGHLRNAVLGDVLARSMKALGQPVEVQNYIDDTGVQLADVVVGFLDIRGMSTAEVAAAPEPFDYLCWDVYAEVGRWYEQDPSRQERRRATLHELESGTGPRAEMAHLVARRVVHRHLKTMSRLDVSYDLLTHESDILSLNFFATAFERLKETGAVHLETSGKNLGCWIMPLSQSEEFQGLEDPDKVIVRSDGTITYVGKDIAYQLWKFGLLGRDFGYRYWLEEGVWETCSGGAVAHPLFGRAERVVNVIDVRQSYLQKIVRAGLQALGHQEEAARSVHFAYEMVALSPATARALGLIEMDGEDKALEMSGRKGIGVKADDLLDQLIAKAREEIAQRNREISAGDLELLAQQIATAALRFFMVKMSTQRVIAFDFDEALSFEGDSGPYLQYSLVRMRNIRRKLKASGMAADVTPEEVRALPGESFPDELWELVLGVAQIGELVAKAVESLEISLIARQALELAQGWNAIYHRYPILQEQNADLRTARLAAAQVFRRGLETLGELLGIPFPERM
jgi:arginyl-tRNA synthetase